MGLGVKETEEVLNVFVVIKPCIYFTFTLV